jgi:hypothetical protein
MQTESVPEISLLAADTRGAKDIDMATDAADYHYAKHQ